MHSRGIALQALSPSPLPARMAMMVAVRGPKEKHSRGDARAGCGWAKMLRGCFAFLVLLLESLTVGNTKGSSSYQVCRRQKCLPVNSLAAWLGEMPTHEDSRWKYQRHARLGGFHVFICHTRSLTSNHYTKNISFGRKSICRPL